jgi:heme exporter protein A
VSDPLVECSGVGIALDRSPILRSVDLRVAAGETLGIVGANGSGKTTLLRVLATLLTPTEGTAKVLGAPLDDVTVIRKIRPEIELIGHTPALYPELTLAENLDFVARLAGIDAAAVDGSLRTVGLTAAAGRRADRASHGMRRRVEFARALLRRPRLLLLDEAHAGLDADARVLVQHVVESVTGEGGAVVMVSHEPDQMTGITDRVARLRDGQLVESP